MEAYKRVFSSFDFLKQYQKGINRLFYVLILFGYKFYVRALFLRQVTGSKLNEMTIAREKKDLITPTFLRVLFMLQPLPIGKI